MTGETRAQTTARRREAILDAALMLFDQQGIEATTLEEIRVGAGVSVGSLYHHFAGKEQVVDALRARSVEEWTDVVLGSMERARSARSGLERGIGAHLDHLERHPAMAAVMLAGTEPTSGAASDAGRRLADANKAVAVRLGRWLARWVEAGEVRQLAPELYAAIILGPCLELARLRLAGRSTLTTTQARTQLSELIWTALSTDQQ